VIDTHAHLDALDDPGAAVARAREAGVTRIISIGTDPASWRNTLAIADQHEGVYVVAGLHPHEAILDFDLRELEQVLRHPKVVAVGETGLDHYRDYAPQDAQAALFVAQLEVAKKRKMPVVIHNRAADGDTVSILRRVFDGTVVLHCFSSPGLLPTALEYGWYISFAGNVTYKNAEELRVAARAVPADLILAETDCPYLTPQPVRGKTNEPAYLAHTIGALADARGEAAGELARQIDANAAAAFGLL
jgi:TatD DNase family protein